MTNFAVAKPRPHILVVDDDPVAQTVHKKLLEQAGYEVTTAQNGEQAVALTKTQSFSVICMDVNMPVMNGLEAATLIRGQEKSIPIIGITAYDGEAKQQTCLANGMTAILHKPLQIDALVEMVEQYAMRASA